MKMRLHISSTSNVLNTVSQSTMILYQQCVGIVNHRIRTWEFPEIPLVCNETYVRLHPPIWRRRSCLFPWQQK